jgi:Xaa-Pro aminopeptidase
MKMRSLVLRASLLLPALFLASDLTQARFPQPKEDYQARREKLRAQVDGPVVLFGYTNRQEGGEVAVFFQDENFYYLSGYEEPDAALLLIPDLPDGKKREGPSEILYLPPRDPRRARWEGPKLGPDDPHAAEKTGFQAVKPYADLRGDLVALSKSYPNFYTPLASRPENGYPHLATSSAWVREALPAANVEDVTAALTAMRMVKSAGELALMQKAIDVSIDAHLAAMRMMRPGLYEYQVAARMKEIHEWGGCSREAYAPIVGAGFYSTVLHYDALNNEIKDGDIVVLDVGGEYGGYAADITRTLPANGKFTPRQREIYEIVLGAQNAALAAIKPGTDYCQRGATSVYKIAFDYINSHGKDLHGHSLGQYYIHGLGHNLGLNVHDPGEYCKPLEPGMVVTMEPGIYIPEENLGVRIEDDVLITETGYKLLSERLPRDPAEIEKIMAQGSAERAKNSRKADD